MSDPVIDRIRQEIEGHKVVIFMKGTPDFPMCGFSAAAVDALRKAGATSVHGIDVLADPEVREGVKRFSNWPTLPQIYIAGEFVGGADIVRELQSKGELRSKIEAAERA